MTAVITIGSRKYEVDLNAPIDISIPLVFNGDQPNTYNVPQATARAYEDGTFVGDTRRGGSCNFEEYRLIPHCNGTHTEGVGHIALERISIHSFFRGVFIPATLISVSPERAEDTPDRYTPPKDREDRLITREAIHNALAKADPDFLRALIIRTLPNDASKTSRRYMENPPPFPSNDAMAYVSELGVNHLLVDIPSVDRTFDEGKLFNHHLYWDVSQGSHDVNPTNHSLKTITEMIYAGNEIPDGKYLLSLQIAPFVADAAPSRPMIFAPRML